jgi:hypothetical protein
MRKKLFCLLSMAVVIAAQSCFVLETVRGNKSIVSQEIDVSDYTEIYCSIPPGEIVYLQAPDETPYFQITTDENILPLLEIEATGNRLNIKCKNNTNILPSKLTIHTHSSHLNKVELTGSGKVYLKGKIESDDMHIRITGLGKVISDDLSCEKAHLTITGSGDIELNGSGDEVSCHITGLGNIDISAYPVRTADCLVTGSGDVLTCVTDKLTAKITGLGNIKYKGEPAEKNIQITGLGKVKQIK